MFDASLRSRLEKPLDQIAARLEFVNPYVITGAGLLIGIGCCVAIAYERWWLGLFLWLANRLADGLDGPIARRRGATDLGGYFDILADFAIYGGVLVGFGLALPETRVVCLVVFLTYYLSGSSFLAFSSLVAKRQLEGDGRSLHFPAGLAEGTETIVAYSVILLFPSHAVTLLWVWAAIVGVTLMQRICGVALLLR